MEYREIQENQTDKLMDSIEALGEAIDLMSEGSPWRAELEVMLLRVAEMNAIVYSDLNRTTLLEFTS